MIGENVFVATRMGHTNLGEYRESNNSDIWEGTPQNLGAEQGGSLMISCFLEPPWKLLHKEKHQDQLSQKITSCLIQMTPRSATPHQMVVTRTWYPVSITLLGSQSEIWGGDPSSYISHTKWLSIPLNVFPPLFLSLSVGHDMGWMNTT